MGGTQSSATRSGHVPIQTTPRRQYGATSPTPLQGTWQDHRRFQRRDSARHGGRRIRMRRSPSRQGRIYQHRRNRHRHVFHALARGRLRRHHTLQLPRHDTHVDVRTRNRMRQHFHLQTIGERPILAGALGRTILRGGRACGRFQCPPWR